MQKYFQFLINVFKYWRFKFESIKTSNSLVTKHFNTWSQADHQNREGLRLALELLENRPAIIVETGTSAHGTDSSRLFDGYVSRFGGRFFSVDINNYPSRRLKLQHSSRTEFFVSDSLSFLSSIHEVLKLERIDFVYLDSWDVDWENPTQSAIHGLAEFKLVQPYLRKGSVLVIDDTPNSLDWIPSEHRDVATKYEQTYGVLPGKGALIVKELKTNMSVRKIWHDYNCVYLFT